MAYSIEGIECIAETSKAILVEVEGDEIWIPKSAVDDDSEVYGKGHVGELIVADWLAEKEGWV